MESINDITNLSFGIEKSIRYHDYRQSFYNNWSKIFICSILLLFGMNQYIQGWNSLFPILILLMVLLSVLSSNKKQIHLNIKQQFGNLLAEIKRNITPSNQDVGNYVAERITIEENEPSIYWALETQCYNEILHAFDLDPNYIIKIPTDKKLLKNYIKYNPLTFKTRGLHENRQ